LIKIEQVLIPIFRCFREYFCYRLINFKVLFFEFCVFNEFWMLFCDYHQSFCLLKNNFTSFIVKVFIQCLHNFFLNIFQLSQIFYSSLHSKFCFKSIKKSNDLLVLLLFEISQVFLFKMNIVLTNFESWRIVVEAVY